ncbi:MAG: hypothetical protein JSR73_18120 [Proteobacteria bacterium]|nr:hypothetical protein [Pseudomonadota bacterium]
MAPRPANARNPFVYGRVLGRDDAACARPAYETAIREAVRDRGRLALAGDRRLGKSSLIERTHERHGLPLLRWDFHQVLSVDDLVRRAAEDLDAFVRALSPVARRVTPWLREVGIGIEDIRVGAHGLEASLRTRVPTDHLKRLLGFLAQVARRRPMSVFIDELQDVRDRLPPREADAVLGLLRSELQRMRVPCFFAGSARDSFRGLFVSEASPFFESARLLEVEPIPAAEFGAFLRKAFEAGGHALSEEAAAVLLAVGGESPNDVQHLAHETWNVAVRATVAGPEIGRALDKILADQTPLADAWLARLTRRQVRVLLAVALYEHLGYATEEFLGAAGEPRGAAVVGALKPCVQGAEPIVEKVGSRYRVRSRYLRLWLCTRRHLVQELVPALRPDAAYQFALRRVCAQLPADLLGPA